MKRYIALIALLAAALVVRAETQIISESRPGIQLRRGNATIGLPATDAATCRSAALADAESRKATANYTCNVVSLFQVRYSEAAPVVTSPPPVVTAPPVTPAPTGRVLYADKCIATAASQLSPSGGDTLIVRAGTYSQACDKLTGQGAGRPGAWNTIKAERDGEVVITAGLDINGSDRHIQLEGLRWEGPSQKNIGGSYVKVLRSAFKDGPPKDNNVKLVIGSGSHHILLEDVVVYGSGGRYDLLVYMADKIVLRRVIARHEGGWSDTKGDPEAGISIYNSQDVLTQNLVVLDSTGRQFESALYHPSNSDRHPGKNISHVGAIILNSGGNGVCWEDSASAIGMSMVDSAIVGARAEGACTNGGSKQVSLRRVLISKTGDHGFAAWGKGTVIIADSTFRDIAGEVVKAGNGTVARTGIGMPDLSRRQGKSGTLWGDPGYDQPTDDPLLPWAQESLVRARLCAGVATGMCAAPSLSGYLRVTQ